MQLLASMEYESEERRIQGFNFQDYNLVSSRRKSLVLAL